MGRTCRIVGFTGFYCCTGPAMKKVNFILCLLNIIFSRTDDNKGGGDCIYVAYQFWTFFFATSWQSDLADVKIKFSSSLIVLHPL